MFSFKSILIAHSMNETHRIITQFASSLLISIYNKSLSLDLTECNKQQVLNVIYSDIEGLRIDFWFLMTYTIPICFILILSLILLYFIIGLASIFGIIFMLFIGVPFYGIAGYKLSLNNRLRMKFSDKRVILITELIRSIRICKMLCYEMPLMNRINEYRKEEIKYTSKRSIFLASIILANFLIPALMLFITLVIYFFGFQYVINSNITLFIIMLFTFIKVGVRGIPIVVGHIVSFFVSCNRLDEFNQRASISTANICDENTNEPFTCIAFENATFVWTAKDEEKNDKIVFSLTDISLKIKRNKLIAIVGEVGCGKTSLIQSMLSEMKIINGKICVHLPDIIYCAQQPYIRNVTLRDNIILDLPFNEIEYQKCIRASALKSDLNKLPNYDLTVIGDEGVTLSGGQKMRVSFARALYRNSMRNSNKIYLFDDPLSCVDIWVGKNMFFNGIYKYLMQRDGDIENTTTCIMVINSHLYLLKYFDEIIVMKKGQIVVNKTVSDLYFNANNIDLIKQYQHILPSIDQINTDTDIDDEKYYNEIENKIDDHMEQDIGNFDIDNFEEELVPSWQLFAEFIRSSLTEFDYVAHWNDNKTKIGKLENRKNNKCNFSMVIIPLIISFIMLCSAPICDVWILLWNQETDSSTTTTIKYILVWFMLLFIIAFGTLYSMYSFAVKIVVKAADYIHCKSLYNILRANTLFFDITPKGDIMNRFTTETFRMDILFPEMIFLFTLFLSSVIGCLMIIIIFIPFSLIPIIIIFTIIIYLNYRCEKIFLFIIASEKRYTSRIGTLFTEVVSSLDSIRAYNLNRYFTQHLMKLIDQRSKTYMLNGYLSRWLGMYQEILLGLIQLIVILLCIYQINHTHSNKQFIILSCWYFLLIQQQINVVSSMYCHSKYAFTSIMKLMHYHKMFEENKKKGYEIVHESKQINNNYDNKAKNKWPNIGNININKVQLRYRKKFDIVLDIDRKITINCGDKVGVCGRTGSGKSSILISIFRLFEPIINDIVIDNLNINQLGLYHLRSNLSIIPQNPILFKGTLKFNIDPFDKCTDNEIWNVLKCVKLFDLINDRDNKLLCVVEENGSNFSSGEKQLICFARAILSKSKILFLDEATSSLDKYTDNIIQKIIRSTKFKDITVICIAHRLQTIIDYDYILLMENGHVIQYDTPTNLLLNQNGKFAQLVKNDKLYYHT